MSRRTLGKQASFWVATAVVAHTIWTSATPALTYPLYAAEWGLTTFATTAIFAIYPVFVVLTLVIFGNVSDFIGRRETMLLGLGV
jgi:MFS family permease